MSYRDRINVGLELRGDPGPVGPAGAAGAVWRSGAGAPATGLGVVGDWYLNDANGDIYEKTGAATYTLRDNLTGPSGSTGSVGPDGPTGPAGSNGTNGTNGTNGVGVPVGGTTGQVLSKVDATDFNTTWSTPSGGSGSPAGSSGEMQFNEAGVFGGAANVLVESEHLVLKVGTDPAAPAAGKVAVFAHSPAGREMVAVQPAVGGRTTLQPHFGKNSIAQWRPAGNSTTITAVGAAALTATGTATLSNMATTNRYTMMRRLEFLVTVAATTAVAGFRSAVALWSVGGTAAERGGFHFVCRFGPATGVATATSRCFVGMGPIAAPTDVEPSTIASIVGVGWDAADTNIQIMHRGAGAITKVNTGIAVPAVDRTSAYELELFSPPGTTQTVGYQFKDLTSGTEFAGTISTNLPTTSTFLAPRGWMSVGGTSSVIGIALMNLYVETDL